MLRRRDARGSCPWYSLPHFGGCPALEKCPGISGGFPEHCAGTTFQHVLWNRHLVLGYLRIVMLSGSANAWKGGCSYTLFSINEIIEF